MKAKFVYESITDFFVPKDKAEIDKVLLKQNGMTYDELMNFTLKYFEAHLEDDWKKRPESAKGLQELVDKVKSGEYRIEFRHNSIVIVDENGKTLRGYAIKNFNKIYKIGNDIGIKSEFEDEPGIITNIRRLPNRGYGDIYDHEYAVDFVDMDGNKIKDIDISRVDLPGWEGVVGNSLFILLGMREGNPIKPEQLI